MAGHQTLQLLVLPWLHYWHPPHLSSHSPASLVPCKIEHEKQLNVHNVPEELHKATNLNTSITTVTVGWNSFQEGNMNDMKERI